MQLGTMEMNLTGLMDHLIDVSPYEQPPTPNTQDEMPRHPEEEDMEKEEVVGKNELMNGEKERGEEPIEEGNPKEGPLEEDDPEEDPMEKEDPEEEDPEEGPLDEDDPEEDPMKEEDLEEELEEEPLDKEDRKEEQLVEEDLEEDPVDKELEPEVTHRKRGRYGRMRRGPCLMDAPGK